jgi:ADP-heptose:LPS heptosyltransferase
MTVLALRALGIGDLATAVPALRALRTAFPAQRLTLAAPAWLHPLVDLVGAVNSCVDVPGLQGGPPAVTPPEVAVNLHGRGPRSHRLLLALRPARLLGFRGPGCPDGPVWRDDEHEVDRWCRLLARYGIVANRGDLSLRTPPVPPAVDAASIVHPGAKAPYRRWPPERFAEVARYLEGNGHRVVVTGSPAERDLALRVARSAGLPHERVLAGCLDVRGLAAIVSAARLVVCGDTGIGHLATAYGTPSVVLFGRVSPRLWGPPTGRRQHRALWHPPEADLSRPPLPRPRPAVPGPDRELLAVTVGEVLDAVNRAECARRAVPSGSGTAG